MRTDQVIHHISVCLYSSQKHQTLNLIMLNSPNLLFPTEKK